MDFRPLYPTTQTLFSPCSNHHNLQLHHEDRFTARSVKKLQEFLGDKVALHHADHELQHLRIFCPHIYFRGCLATWQSPELFQPLPDDTDQTISNIIQHTYPAHLRQKYKWGFNTKFKMPIWGRPPESQKTMEKRPHHHLLLQVLLWPTLTRHLQRPQHYDPSSSTSITRTTLHSTTVASFPRLSSRHTSFRGSSRSQ